MLRLRAEIRGLNDSLIAIRQAVTAGRREFVDNCAVQVLNTAREVHPWKDKTGNLRRSHRVFPAVSAGAYTLSIPYFRTVGVANADAYYAGYVEYRYDRGARWAWMSPAAHSILGFGGSDWARSQLSWAMGRAFAYYAPMVRVGSSMWIGGSAVFQNIPSPKEIREAQVG